MRQNQTIRAVVALVLFTGWGCQSELEKPFQTRVEEALDVYIAQSSVVANGKDTTTVAVRLPKRLGRASVEFSTTLGAFVPVRPTLNLTGQGIQGGVIDTVYRSPRVTLSPDRYALSGDSLIAATVLTAGYVPGVARISFSVSGDGLNSSTLVRTILLPVEEADPNSLISIEFEENPQLHADRASEASIIVSLKSHSDSTLVDVWATNGRIMHPKPVATRGDTLGVMLRSIVQGSRTEIMGFVAGGKAADATINVRIPGSEVQASDKVTLAETFSRGACAEIDSLWVLEETMYARINVHLTTSPITFGECLEQDYNGRGQTVTDGTKVRFKTSQENVFVRRLDRFHDLLEPTTSRDVGSVDGMAEVIVAKRVVGGKASNTVIHLEILWEEASGVFASSGNVLDVEGSALFDLAPRDTFIIQTVDSM